MSGLSAHDTSALPLDEAASSLELGPVQDLLEQWRIRCWATRDKQDHRRTAREAVKLLTGEEPPEDEPAEATEARLRHV